MSKPKNAAVLAGALAVVLGFSATSVLAGCGAGEPGPYRTVVPAPSPMVSVPADVQAQTPAQEFVPVPAPTPESTRLESSSGEPADSTGPGSAVSGSDESAAQAQIPTPVPTAEQLELAERTVWDPAERDRAAAALTKADAYTAAHSGTAEAAVYSSIRRDLACGSAENGTALVTRALRAAGYTFSGLAPQDIVSWFAAHPGSGTLVRDPGSARPGSVLLTTGACGTRILGVYVADGLAVFAGADLPATNENPDEVTVTAAADKHAAIAPVDLVRSVIPAAGLPADPFSVYVRPAPFG